MNIEVKNFFAFAVQKFQEGKFQEALSLTQKILKKAPKNADAHYLLGLIYIRLSLHEMAVKCLEVASSYNPYDPTLFNNLGNSLQELNRHKEAVSFYQKALAINPEIAEIYNNLGNAFQALERFDEATNSYQKALKIRADYPEALTNLGVTYQKLKRVNESIECHKKALIIAPNFAEALCNLGNVFRELKEYDEAISSFKKAISINPNFAKALFCLGITLQGLNQFGNALKCYQKSLEIKPDYLEAIINSGVAFIMLKQFENAVECFNMALRINSQDADTHNNKGVALFGLKRFHEASESFQKALSIAPSYPFAFGMQFFAKMMVCDWSNFNDQLNLLNDKIENYENATASFPVLSLTSSLVLQGKAAKIWVNEKCSTSHFLPDLSKYPKHKKIRIGYFSPDFREHPVSRLTAEMFEIHDRTKFEIYAFSFGLNTQDALRKRLELAFDRFIDVQDSTDEEIALLSRKMEIDIAVDLAGFTDDCRTNIFAMRAAPIQVSYIGYLGTMGAEYIDYLIADKTTIPEKFQHYYAEKIAYIPSYQANDSKRCIGDIKPNRQELGLPESGFVFCCFNNTYKITPIIFDCWMRLLKRVRGSVMFLYAPTELAAANLRKEAAKRNVASERLIFAKRVPISEHLARYSLADLFLDTLPYNAGTSASDALWAGLPVLTCAGEAFASRVAASLLNAIQLNELITFSLEEYEEMAVELATNPGKLDEIKLRLSVNKLTTPLFDTKLFTKHIEAAYTEMYKQYQAGLPFQHIII